MPRAGNQRGTGEQQLSRALIAVLRHRGMAKLRPAQAAQTLLGTNATCLLLLGFFEDLWYRFFSQL